MIKPLNALTAALALSISPARVESSVSTQGPPHNGKVALLVSESVCHQGITFKHDSSASWTKKIVKSLNEKSLNINGSNWLQPIVTIEKTDPPSNAFIAGLLLVNRHKPNNPDHFLGDTVPSKREDLPKAITGILANHSQILNAVSRVYCKKDSTPRR